MVLRQGGGVLVWGWVLGWFFRFRWVVLVVLWVGVLWFRGGVFWRVTVGFSLSGGLI